MNKSVKVDSFNKASVIFALSVVLGTVAYAWTGAPAGTPPANNVDAPVNVGNTIQLKAGSLGIDGLLKAYTAFNFAPGAGEGKILTSDAEGNASWTSTSSLGIGTSGIDGINFSALSGCDVLGTDFNGNIVCKVLSPTSCTVPWGGTIASGQSVTTYQTAAVPYGQTCESVSQNRLCTNTVLSGSYTNRNCTVTPGASCPSPWNTTVSSGQSVTAYQTTAVTSGQTCASVSESRLCTNGVLGGSYTNRNCTVCGAQYYVLNDVCTHLYTYVVRTDICGGSGECFDCYRAKPTPDQKMGYVASCYAYGACGNPTAVKNVCYNLYGAY